MSTPALDPDLEPDRKSDRKPDVASDTASDDPDDVRSSRLARITISVDSIERARTFYEQVVGLGAKYELPGLLMLSTTGQSIEVLLHERMPTPGDAGIAASFAVDDVDAATEAAIALGANLVDAAADQPWGERQSVIHDIDGHVICLVAPIQPK